LFTDWRDPKYINKILKKYNKKQNIDILVAADFFALMTNSRRARTKLCFLTPGAKK
jgi:hypothetical protein